MSDVPYSTIEVTGPDAEAFLQGQLTADLADLQPGSPGRAAWCNPKGRVICIFAVLRIADGFLLTLPAELSEHVVQRLTMFRFRSKVDFQLRPASSDELADGGAGSGFAEWRNSRLLAGVPEIYGEQSEQFTPHMLNLDLLGAVSLDKGCYTGQEIIARTHYRGATKRRLHRFRSAQAVAAGASITSEGRSVGEVVNAIDCDLLAVVANDKVDAELLVEDVRLTHMPGDSD